MLKKLQKLIPVPSKPIDIDESRLAATEKKLKVQFPKDYLEFSKIYGSGKITAEGAYGWEIISPFRPKYPKFVRDFFEDEDEYRRATENMDVPLGLFPEPGGLLPFGHRDDIYLTWKTDGKPDKWTVVVIWLYEPDGYEEFPLNFSQFLFALLNREIIVTPWKTPWNPKTDITFKSIIRGY